MPRFDVYANPDASERARIPYFLDVQNDHIHGLRTKVMVPLWSADVFDTPAADLNPTLDVAGISVVMDVAALGAVPLNALKGAVGNVGRQQLVIQNALDALFGAY